jgi:hypothetical protein
MDPRSSKLGLQVYLDTISREQIEAAVKRQKLTGVSIAQLMTEHVSRSTGRRYAIRRWGLIDSDGRPFAIALAKRSGVITFFTRGGGGYCDECKPVVVQGAMEAQFTPGDLP